MSTEARRPTKAKLMGEDWRVRWPRRVDEEGSEGNTCYNDKTILVRSGQTPVDQRKTLLHELIHVADNFSSAGLTERQVECLEHGLWQIFEMNPTLRRFVWGH